MQVLNEAWDMADMPRLFGMTRPGGFLLWRRKLTNLLGCEEIGETQGKAK